MPGREKRFIFERSSSGLQGAAQPTMVSLRHTVSPSGQSGWMVRSAERRRPSRVGGLDAQEEVAAGHRLAGDAARADVGELLLGEDPVLVVVAVERREIDLVAERGGRGLRTVSAGSKR